MDYARNLGKTGVCVECGQHDDEASVVVAEHVILQFLFAHTSVSPSSKLPPARIPKVIRCTEAVHVSKKFEFSKSYDAFSYISHDEHVYTDESGEQKCTHKAGAFLIMPSRNPVDGEEAFFWGVCHD